MEDGKRTVEEPVARRTFCRRVKMSLTSGTEFMRLRRIIGLVVVAAAAVVALPTAANAAPAAAPSKQHPYCVLHASQGNTTSCYSTFTAAISDGTNGRVTDAPAAASSTSADLDRRINAATTKAGTPQAKAAAGGTVIGINYWDVGYAKYSWVVETSYGCDNDKTTRDWLISLRGSGWDNQISSFRTFGNCQSFNYDAYDWTGPFVWSDTADNPDLRIYNYPAGYDFNDRISSISWN
jgi:hypothetical protein